MKNLQCATAHIFRYSFAANLIAAAMDHGLAEEDACAIIKVFSGPPAVH